MRDDKHGPLPYVLMLLTFVTGVVDAVSYLKLDHVFVANMTGNVVFLGFAIADAQRFSIGGSLTAIVAFMVGALIGGRVVTHFGDHRGRLLATALYIEIALAAVALAIVALLWSVDYLPLVDMPQHVAHLSFWVHYGDPRYGFAEQFRRWCNEARLPKDCRAHGLRGTCATRLAHDGATPHQIMAWTGHKSLSQVQRYTRAANQLHLARKAIERSDNKDVTNLRRKGD